MDDAGASLMEDPVICLIRSLAGRGWVQDSPVLCDQLQNFADAYIQFCNLNNQAVAAVMAEHGARFEEIRSHDDKAEATALLRIIRQKIATATTDMNLLTLPHLASMLEELAQKILEGETFEVTRIHKGETTPYEDIESKKAIAMIAARDGFQYAASTTNDDTLSQLVRTIHDHATSIYNAENIMALFQDNAARIKSTEHIPEEHRLPVDMMAARVLLTGLSDNLMADFEALRDKSHRAAR
jgi:non-ribosomal peptide synthetase component E (peptide arylation enzyme)